MAIITQDYLRSRFPGLCDHGLLCTREHPDGSAPGSLYHLHKCGIIKIEADGGLIVYDWERLEEEHRKIWKVKS